MAVLTVPKPLREKLGDEAVDSLVDLLNKSDENVKKDVIGLSEERLERRLTEVITKIDTNEEKFSAKINALEEKFERRLSEEISKLRIEMSKNYVNIIRWMFIFWIGQVAVMFGIVFGVVKFVK